MAHWLSGYARQQLRALRERDVVAIDLHLHPGAGIAAVVHTVIHQSRMAPHGDAAPRRAEVGFGGNGVLLVAQVIAHVGE